MQELIPYPNWVVWRMELTDTGKLTKVPYDPRTGQKAKSNDSNTWTTYADAYHAAYGAGSSYTGIGFMLSQHDPFCFIDLDDPYKDQPDAARAERNVRRQEAIAAAFPATYQERSPSGRGLHIVVRGHVPQGRKRETVEVYSYARFMTVTGDVYNAAPITECQEMLSQLWSELSDGSVAVPVTVQESEQRFSDDEIYAQALNGSNGERFERLYTGDLSEYGNDQSRADFALIDIIGFYSRNIEQIVRIFHASALGKRDKAHRKDYLRKMVLASFDNQVPDVDLSALKQTITNQIQAMRSKKDQPKRKQRTAMQYTFPPGMLGEIATFIYQASPRPVAEISLAAAIGLMAGVCGRSFNVSGTGLNQYVVLLAKTGVGKEAMNKGITALMNAVIQHCPAAETFLGPGEIASGQGLIRWLSEQSQSFVSVIGEFGFFLEQMISRNASSSEQSKRRMLLKLYGESGRGMVVREGAYSQKGNNVAKIYSPAFSLVGECTPETFFSNLDEFSIQNGLLPRFSIIDYQGVRVPSNKSSRFVVPNDQLVASFVQLCTTAMTYQQAGDVQDVTFTADAQSFLDRFDAEVDDYINASDVEASRQLWNRAHLKVMKLAALVAVGIHPYAPEIDMDAVQWAHRIVVHDTETILARFEEGKVGRDATEQNQVSELSQLIADYVVRPYSAVQKYKIAEKMFTDRVIPHSYALNRLQQRTAFSKDARGPALAVKRSFDSLIAEGVLRELRPSQVLAQYQKTAKCYAVTDVEHFA